MNRPTLAAVLIVKDEAEHLPACLASLRGLADAVHVHDTGSADGTPEIAAGHGAVVTRGPWTGDFAAARNAAHAGVTADWILVADADDRVHGDAELLRPLLARTRADVLRAEVHVVQDTGPYTLRQVRLYRTGAARWAGRIHEHLVGAGGGEPAADEVPATAVRFTHLGYAAAADRVGKSRRNLALARQTLAELSAQGDGADPAMVARTLLDLGRAHVGAEQHAEAAETLETLRELYPGTPQWLQGTDFLARILLATGLDARCLELVAELRAAGAPAAYCDWLAAQALAQLGDVRTAARLLSGVTEVVDTAGRRHDPAGLRELRGLMDQLAALTVG
ncbi:glycosyltransferase [Spirilliplanes yamanashiensis]|uniref:Glycosyltransferase 2-like domain-containing protein n=1 Tax=Spirilliplanes yamanashiensis TaxID=42233 RepID=A0A8J3YB64_9ACTN|nr:glycosyltransferase [Spirilliplanes yamanashiensis]MDP9818040.1 hypothetical protein [Spirilliplanes yamanashiensis]GIJ04849.1 hypothetical protein Sya03_42010 [Spirilliplanes yamanashiensis]